MEKTGSKIKKIASLHIATILVAGIILWLTLAPSPMGEQSIQLFEGADKIVHALMFFGLAATFILEEYIIGKVRTSIIWISAACSAISGIIIEVLQYRMALGRSFEWGDIIADSSGALAAALLSLLFIHK